ncbi:MAG: hypothetical protein K1X66_07395 [Verrucomicrobiae bacterium]|nr:hypothetical protein [Verrucomicrobiae bacterium]
MFVRDPVRKKQKELKKVAADNASLKKSLEKLIEEAKQPQPVKIVPTGPKTLRVENKRAKIKFLRYFLILLALALYILYLRSR